MTDKQHIYRGKRVDTGEWVYGSAMVWNGIAQIFVHHHMLNNLWNVNAIRVIPETVGRYWMTLLGKNEEFDLYPGDVFGLKTDSGDIIKKLVRYSNKQKNMVLVNVNDLQFEDMWDIEQSANPAWWLERRDGLLYLGNIYDTPELLEVE